MRNKVCRNLWVEIKVNLTTIHHSFAANSSPTTTVQLQETLVAVKTQTRSNSWSGMQVLTRPDPAKMGHPWRPGNPVPALLCRVGYMGELCQTTAAEPIEMPFGGWLRVSPQTASRSVHSCGSKEPCIKWELIDPPREGALLRGHAHPVVHCTLFACRRTNAFVAARETRRRCGLLPNYVGHFVIVSYWL